MRSVLTLVLCTIIATAVCGCARRTSISDLSSSGADIGVKLSTIEGQSFEGRLVSLDHRTLVAELSYGLGEGVELVGVGDDRMLLVGGERVAGRVVGVESVDGSRVALVRRVFATGDVATATFHQSRGEASRGTIVSLLLGPLVGGLLALLI